MKQSFLGREWHRLSIVQLMVWGVGLLWSVGALTACDDSDGYSVGDMAVDWVTVRKAGLDVAEFEGDTWGRLWTAVPDQRLQYLRNGERVFLTFNPLYDHYPAGYDCSVKVLDLRPVLTKKVEELTAENEESFGNDPLIVPKDGMWLGGNCLNVNFLQVLPKEKKHRISLVRRAGTSVDAAGYQPLELRYHTFDDVTDYVKEGWVSFHLSSLLEEAAAAGTPLKGIRVKVMTPDQGAQERVLDFKQPVRP